jgi:hypothetical protein
MAGTDLHYAPVIVGAGICQDGLGMCLLQHVIQVGENEVAIQAKLDRVPGRELKVGFGNPHALNVRAMEGVFEESFDVPVYQSCDSNSQGWRARGNLGESGEREA